MNLKESILNMPAWRAGVCVLLIILGISAVFEVILSHTVFHVFDRMIEKFDKEKNADVADMDDVEKSEQRDYCDQYKRTLEEKDNLAKRNPSEFSYDFAKNTLHSHEKDIQFAIKQHYFNLKKCEATLKSEKA